MDSSKVCEYTAPNKYDNTSCTKKQNLLVYEQNYKCTPNLKKKQVYVISPSSPCQVKKIRVCSTSELKRMCPPKLCECKPKKSGLKGIASLLALGLKGAIAGALIYGSYQLGIWGDSDDSENLFKEICGTASPIFCSKANVVPVNSKGEVCEIQAELTTCPRNIPNSCCEQSPSISGGLNTLKGIWNCGIIWVFDKVANAPERLTCTYGWVAAKLNLSEQYRVPRCETAKEDLLGQNDCPE